MEKRIFLFVDGSNLYGSQYELFGPGKYLSFSILILHIENILRIKFQKIYFYASYSSKPKVPNKKQAAYLLNEGLFYRDVKNTNNVEFFKGYRSPTSGKEKEVDVKLAVDMVNFAHRNKFDQMYLISGDADFFHAMFAVINLKKYVGLICMSNNIMYKAAYYVATHILHINKSEKIIETKTQKSPIHHNLLEAQLIKEITTNNK